MAENKGDNLEDPNSGEKSRTAGAPVDDPQLNFIQLNWPPRIHHPGNLSATGKRAGRTRIPWQDLSKEKPAAPRSVPDPRFRP